jgi:uncharacterized protein YndB with AHSA1/START domain
MRPKLSISTPSEREIRIVRTFAAPRALVFEAFTRPELLRRWLYGPDGWTLEVCDIELRVGGSYRYGWVRERDGKRMGATGTYREILVPERIVASELFDEPWYAGEALVTSEFTEQAAKLVTLNQTHRYESRAARDTVLRSPMAQGSSAGYDRLDAVLESLER